MNSEAFKRAIRGHLHRFVKLTGGLDAARDMFVQMPEHTVHFVAGGIVATASEHHVGIVPWRDEPFTGALVFTLEEIRRTLDYVRLYLEADSTTS